MNKKTGFSLIELSIVLILIGFIVGVILYGQSSSEKAETQALLMEIEQYLSAVSIFRGKYNYRPGDSPNAELHFSGDAATDGNGNGLWDTAQERDVLWVQLSAANMIAQEILLPANSSTTKTIGTFRPRSKVNGTGWTFLNELSINPPSGSDIMYYNILRFGGMDSSQANGGEFLTEAMISIEKHRYIDLKIDQNNSPLSGRYIVDAACAIQNTTGTTSYAYNKNTSKLCTGNIAEFNSLDVGTYTPP